MPLVYYLFIITPKLAANLEILLALLRGGSTLATPAVLETRPSPCRRVETPPGRPANATPFRRPISWGGGGANGVAQMGSPMRVRMEELEEPFIP